jgi:hypothetical protein
MQNCNNEQKQPVDNRLENSDSFEKLTQLAEKFNCSLVWSDLNSCPLDANITDGDEDYVIYVPKGVVKPGGGITNVENYLVSPLYYADDDEDLDVKPTDSIEEVHRKWHTKPKKNPCVVKYNDGSALYIKTHS